MSFLPSLPNMLQPDKLRELNDHLVDTTGCFAFLKTDQVLFSPAPQQWRDAYTVFGIGLYAVYHDYGCKFLRHILLSDELCPDALQKPNRHRKHVDALNHIIRVNLAHGLLYTSQRRELQSMLADYYLQDSSYSWISSAWPDYINQLSEQQWMRITQRLVKDSDSLYEFLWSWGDEWARSPDNLHELREQFVSWGDNFAYSFDSRICSPLLKNYGVRPRDVSHYTQSNDHTTPINRWRDRLIEAYRNGKYHPEELCYELDMLIKQELEPPAQSSVDIAAQFGF